MAFGASEAEEGHSGEVLAFNVRDVAASLTPCPANFQAKVAYWKDTLAQDVRPRQLSLEDIEKKLERAQRQREEVRGRQLLVNLHARQSYASLAPTLH